MKVAFDSRPATEPHGIGRYTRSLLEALREGQRGEIVETRDPRRCQVFHSPWIDGALLRSPVPMVVTLHDLIPLKRRGEYLRSGLRFRLRYLAVQRAVRVIVPTHVVAEDAMQVLDLPADRITVIAEAAAPVLSARPDQEVREVRERFALPERYLLWVGGLRTPDPRKRVAALARARRTMPLVLVGAIGPWASELPDVTRTGEVSDEELAAIYTGAHALVFPSDEEGFGLPPVEALACGTPVAACDVPAVREVLDGRVAFSGVDDLDGLILAAESARRPAPPPPAWSWQDAATATWDVYAEAMRAQPRWRAAATLAALTGVKVAVPIISTNEGELLRHALPAALGQEDAEVVVFDNASEDSTASVAAELGVRCVRLAERHSYCRAMNVACRSLDGEALLMMQPDCFLTPGFLAAAVRHFEDPEVGSVAPKLIRADGPDERQRLDALDTAGMIVDRRRKNGLVGHGRPAGSFSAPGAVFGADGAAALYRRKTLEDTMVDGQIFDEDMVVSRDGASADWGSDADLAWRVRLLGWRCVYEPTAVAYHVRRYSPTNRPSTPEWQRMVQFRNRYLMIIKNDPIAALLRDLPFILPYELAALAFALLREPFLLAGYKEAAALYPRMRRKRTMLQRRRRQRGVPAPPYGLTPPS